MKAFLWYRIGVPFLICSLLLIAAPFSGTVAGMEINPVVDGIGEGIDALRGGEAKGNDPLPGEIETRLAQPGSGPLIIQGQRILTDMDAMRRFYANRRFRPAWSEGGTSFALGPDSPLRNQSLRGRRSVSGRLPQGLEGFSHLSCTSR